MKEILKKSISMLLCMVLMIGLFPIGSQMVKAENYSGKCGDDVYWTFDTSTGTLNIYGNGDMYNFESPERGDFDYNPWAEYRNEIVKIEISSGVTSIGERAFAGCSSLTKIEIPNSVTSIGNYAFSGCEELTSITMPNTLKSIGKGAFSLCMKLTSIIIPDGVTSIESTTFAECQCLESITIPKSVTEIGRNAFPECYSLSNVYYGGTEDDWNKIEINLGGNSQLISALPFNKNSEEPTSSIEEPTKGTEEPTSSIEESTKGTEESTTPIYVEQPTTTKQNGNNITTDTSMNNTKTTSVNAKKPAKVKFSLKAGKKKVSLKWSKVKDVSGYTIYYKTSKKGKWKKLKNLSAKKTKYVKKKLKSGKKYYFTVKAYKKVNGKKVYGKFKIKKVKVK